MEKTSSHSTVQLLITVLLLFLEVTPANADWGTLVSATDEHINLGPSIEWIEDSSNQLTFEQVRTLPEKAFNYGDKYTFNKGYTSSGYWLRFRLDYSADLIDTLWLLEIPFPLLDYVALYSPDQDNNYSVIYTGDRSPFSQRDLDSTDFVFKLRPQRQKNI